MQTKEKAPIQTEWGLLGYRELTMTYSHMGEPHYHWRNDVSLLSSRRDQVVPSCYCRQQRGYRYELVKLLAQLCLTIISEPESILSG